MRLDGDSTSSTCPRSAASSEMRLARSTSSPPSFSALPTACRFKCDRAATYLLQESNPMFLSKLSLPRRTFLKGVGAAVAVPFFEAMLPAFKASAAAATPRFGAVFVPNGAIVEDWIPKAAGAGFDLSPIPAPLDKYKESLVVISNLTRAHPGVVEGDHAISAAGWLSGVLAKRTQAEDVLGGTTIDQIVARQIGQETPFPSLELATADFTGYVGACTSGYSCVYTNTISWSSPTRPLPMEINPRAVFERLFGRPGSPAEREARFNRTRSIL